MKLVIEKEDLAEGLNKVQSIVHQKVTIPILANVLLEAKDDSLVLTTTDLDVSIQCSIKADVQQPGGITLPAKRLTNLVRELPSAQVEIATNDEEQARIVCGNSEFNLVGISEDDYPPLPEYGGGNSYTLDQGVLKDMLRKTSYAASVDESRFILNGSLLKFDDTNLTVVATDGRRLAMTEQKLEGKKAGNREEVVPTKTVNELIRSLGDEGDVIIYFAEKQIAFTFGGLIVISKVIDGTFPTFEQVIPKSSTYRISMDREGLMQAVRRAAMVTTEHSSSVRLTFENNQLQIAAATADVGESDERIPIKFDAEKISTTFNPDFIIEPLRQLESDEVFVEISDNLSPAVIKSDIPFIYVIMPLRLN